ncbi:hypothetical protein G5B39_14770 (plasmid) [Rhodobacteraceae bacterium SC52]|nr:hypothetical protein G5B39_14770 [Rhodobacteraceae bacterium SC52]
MKSHFVCLTALLLALAACDVPITSSDPTEVAYIETLPDGVIALAAPNQNLQAVKVLPEDGCYWYLHDGPVEATLLPLRSRDGRPICTRAPDEVAT